MLCPPVCNAELPTAFDRALRDSGQTPPVSPRASKSSSLVSPKKSLIAAAADIATALSPVETTVSKASRHTLQEQVVRRRKHRRAQVGDAGGGEITFSSTWGAELPNLGKHNEANEQRAGKARPRGTVDIQIPCIPIISSIPVIPLNGEREREYTAHWRDGRDSRNTMNFKEGVEYVYERGNELLQAYAAREENAPTDAICECLSSSSSSSSMEGEGLRHSRRSALQQSALLGAIGEDSVILSLCVCVFL